MIIRINVTERLLVLAFLALIGGTTTVAGKVIYVDGVASGANDGSDAVVGSSSRETFAGRLLLFCRRARRALAMGEAENLH